MEELAASHADLVNVLDPRGSLWKDLVVAEGIEPALLVRSHGGDKDSPTGHPTSGFEGPGMSMSLKDEPSKHNVWSNVRGLFKGCHLFKEAARRRATEASQMPNSQAEENEDEPLQHMEAGSLLSFVDVALPDMISAAEALKRDAAMTTSPASPWSIQSPDTAAGTGPSSKASPCTVTPTPPPHPSPRAIRRPVPHLVGRPADRVCDRLRLRELRAAHVHRFEKDTKGHRCGRQVDGADALAELREFALAVIGRYGSAQAAFSAFDINRNGSLSRSEFVTYAKTVFNGDVAAIFKALDLDRQGDITTKEFSQLDGLYGEMKEAAMARAMARQSDKRSFSLLPTERARDARIPLIRSITRSSSFLCEHDATHMPDFSGQRGVAAVLAPSTGAQVPLQRTNFTLASVGTLMVKPMAKTHPMLASIDRIEAEDGPRSWAAGGSDCPTSQRVDAARQEMSSTILAERLETVRCRGTATSDSSRMRSEQPPERPKFGNDEKLTLSPAQRQLLLHPCRRRAQRAHDDVTFRSADDFKRIVGLLAPGSASTIPADALVPIMFWLGATRQHSAVLAASECAFGPGDIPVSAIVDLALYHEVQVGIAEVINVQARKDSLDHLCEFVTNRTRLREWFFSMRQDAPGRVQDVFEVQHLLLRMGCSPDKKALLRFLSNFIEVDCSLQRTAPWEVAPTSGPSAATQSSVAMPLTQRPLGVGRGSHMNAHTLPTERSKIAFSSFCKLLCRCVFTWCLSRALDLVDPATPGLKTPASAALTNAAKHHVLVHRWTEVSRAITLSLLVNHRFWGREARIVLANLSHPAVMTNSQHLSPEQWRALFQRVRAQGMASTFPEGEESGDPDFLQKKASCQIPAT